MTIKKRTFRTEAGAARFVGLLRLHGIAAGYARRGIRFVAIWEAL